MAFDYDAFNKASFSAQAAAERQRAQIDAQDRRAAEAARRRDEERARREGFTRSMQEQRAREQREREAKRIREQQAREDRRRSDQAARDQRRYDEQRDRQDRQLDFRAQELSIRHETTLAEFDFRRDLAIDERNWLPERLRLEGDLDARQSALRIDEDEVSWRLKGDHADADVDRAFDELLDRLTLEEMFARVRQTRELSTAAADNERAAWLYHEQRKSDAWLEAERTKIALQMQPSGEELERLLGALDRQQIAGSADQNEPGEERADEERFPVDRRFDDPAL